MNAIVDDESLVFNCLLSIYINVIFIFSLSITICGCVWNSNQFSFRASIKNVGNGKSSIGLDT